MKKIVALAAALFMLCTLSVVAFADTFNGTMVRSNNADPNLFFHNGKYYLTQTGTSRVAVFETEHVDELNSLSLSSNISYTAFLNGVIYDPAVVELFGEGAEINGTWSPEIHYFSEEQFPGQSGWYMFLALRKNTGDSSMVRMVVLKSTTNSPKGPYGHPTKGTKNYSQPVLDKDGNIYDEWACGQTVLEIPEGKYKGIYAMWVAEVGRGQSGSSGRFYQKIMIAKMKSPWQLDGEPGVVTTPTQSWEYAGASSTHPRVVEGATPVYGKNGEIFITYSGSGYWSDYGLGQLTWNGGDPLKTSSWVKLSVSRGNPIFSAVNAENLRGAGHASFLTDTNGNGFICYHAYAYNAETDKKASSRDAYIEPYYIDYSASNGVSKGVIRIGKNGDGVPCDTASKITFNTSGSYLSTPTVTAVGGEAITLSLSCTNATGYLIYRSTDGKTFDYLATVDSATYTDSEVTAGKTYYYRAYAYREEEISDASVSVKASAKKYAPKAILTATATCQGVTVTDTSGEDISSYNLYYSTDGKTFTHCGFYDTVSYVHKNVEVGKTYYYYVRTDKVGCSLTDSDVISVTVSHSEASEVAKAPTCTTDGYTAYTYCFNCNEVLSGKDVIPATGHVDTTTETVDATCTADGYATVICKCGEVVSTEVIPASGHSYALYEEEIPATTTSVGKTAVYTCGNCGDTYGGEEIPMLEEEEVFTMTGDANGDGVIGMLDVLRTLKAIVMGDVEFNSLNADVDGDGEITIADVLAILSLALNN